MLDMLEGWRTIIFNSVLVVTGTLTSLDIISTPENFMSDLNGAMVALIGVVGFVLRMITTGVVGWKK